MKFLSYNTGSEWVSPIVSSAQNEAALQLDVSGSRVDYRERVEQFLTETLLAENLVVLCGLGTSLCLNSEGGDNKVAPTMKDLWDAVQKKAGTGFSKIRAKVKYPESEGENIELLLSQCQLSERLAPDPEIADFIATAEKIIVSMCRFVDGVTPLKAHEAFLLKAARRSTRQPRLQLFTTNYDLCFETAASRSRFIVVDGFSHTHPQEFDGGYFGYDFVRREKGRETPDFIPNVFHLYKLHGSVDWRLDGSRVLRDPDCDEPLLIYPRHSKFESSYDQPFIELMARFQITLRQPNTGLIVVGFGFNDHHVVQPIMSAVQANVGLKAVIVDPFLEEAGKQPLQDVAEMIKAGDSRLALLEATFQELVEILPSLVSETEEEAHRSRLRAVREKR